MSSARDAITALIHRYAESLDRGDFAAVAALFDKGTYGAAAGPRLAGREAVERALRELVRVYDDGTPRTAHVTTNVIVDVDDGGRRATARSYFTVFQKVTGVPLQAIISGRYHDSFVLDGDGWRFDERVIHMDLVGDMSHHMLGDRLG